MLELITFFLGWIEKKTNGLSKGFMIIFYHFENHIFSLMQELLISKKSIIKVPLYSIHIT